MILLKMLTKVLRFLGSETSSGAIAMAVTVGFALGLLPLASMQAVLLVVVLLFFRINIFASLFFTGLFKLLSLLLVPIFDGIGRALLEADALRGLWTFLYNSIFYYAYLHQSVVLGATLIVVLFAPFVYLLSRRLVDRYRASVEAWVERTRLMRYLQATKLYALYRWAS